MQIIESTIFGLRSAIFRLEAGNGAPCFHLFPMIHLAESAFYEEISQRLNNYVPLVVTCRQLQELVILVPL